MSDFTFPSTVTPSTSALTWIDNTAVFKSPLSGATRTETRPGGRWSLQLTVSNLKNLTGANDPCHELEAYLFKLNGSTNRAVIKDHAYRRSGPGGGTPLVYGGAETGLDFRSSGWPNSTTVLYAGDRVGLTTGQMCVVSADVTSDGAGFADIFIHAPLRGSPDHASAIEIDAPAAKYILTNKASLASAPGIFKTIMVQFEEAIP